VTSVGLVSEIKVAINVLVKVAIKLRLNCGVTAFTNNSATSLDHFGNCFELIDELIHTGHFDAGLAS